MGRTARDKRPHLPPVQRIELSGEHLTLRLVLALVMLVLGVGLLVHAFMGLISPETGWQTVRTGGSTDPTCAGDFTFLYESASRTEANGVTNFYTDACQRAYRLFHSDQEFEGEVNIYTINRHPNEALEVDPGLYAAFSAIVESGRRELYLGPVYERYDDLFYCQDDAQLVDFDPRLSDEVREEYAGILAYANDPRAISLELLDGNRVRLNVSEAYLSWAAEEEITRFIDFAWMKNAFVADYLAEELAAGGYTRGTLSSYDGFSRNMDDRGGDYSYPLYHRHGDTVLSLADLHYDGPMSLVRMREYPLGGLDAQQYYTLKTGEVRTLYLDTADALCKSAIDTLVCYSREKGCAQLLLEMIPVYIADEFREDAIPALAREGIQSIYCQDGVVWYTDPDAVLENVFNRDDMRYTAKQIVLS